MWWTWFLTIVHRNVLSPACPTAPFLLRGKTDYLNLNIKLWFWRKGRTFRSSLPPEGKASWSLCRYSPAYWESGGAQQPHTVSSLRTSRGPCFSCAAPTTCGLLTLWNSASLESFGSKSVLWGCLQRRAMTLFQPLVLDMNRNQGASRDCRDRFPGQAEPSRGLHAFCPHSCQQLPFGSPAWVCEWWGHWSYGWFCFNVGLTSPSWPEGGSKDWRQVSPTKPSGFRPEAWVLAL